MGNYTKKFWIAVSTENDVNQNIAADSLKQLEDDIEKMGGNENFERKCYVEISYISILDLITKVDFYRLDPDMYNILKTIQLKEEEN